MLNMLEVSQIPEEATVLVLADSDKALIELVLQHDQHAFRQLYDRHLARVYALCLRLTGNRQLAEDATQEVFIQLWRKIHLFAGGSSFTTWLHRLATNTTISYLRKQKTWRQRMIGSDDYEDQAEQLAAAADFDTASLLPYLARLPERARLVFVLQAIEGYRQDHIATAMGISVGTVKAQYHRARFLLEQWLGDAPQEDTDA